MQVTRMNLRDIRANPDNPRVIRDEKFKKLVQSLRDFPEMLEIRPIVVNAEHIVLGGNMRLRACQEAGLREVPVIIAGNLTPEQQREFIIKDNVAFGEWDWDMLANDWNIAELGDWGVSEVQLFQQSTTDGEERDIDLPSMASAAESYLNNTIRQIVLYFDKDTHADVLERLSKIGRANDIRDDNAAVFLLLLEAYERRSE